MPATSALLRRLTLATLVVWGASVLAAGDDQAEKAVALLDSRCFKCHSHSAGKNKGGLVMDSLAGLTTGGDGGAALIPGDPAKSLFLQNILSTDPEVMMPPKGDRLTKEEVTLLQDWVKSGATWPKSRTKAPVAGRYLPGTIGEKEKGWWAYQPVKLPELPAGKSAHPIDRFIDARLAKDGLTPSGEAERGVLIRRVTFDATGLPPSPEDVAAFVQSTDPLAYEKLVDRLLASPAYGQRMARAWLDLVRYADSDGFRIDDFRPTAWRYRDYVIKAYNENKPYDRFVQEQLAGDELFPGDPDALTALGYLRHWIYEYNNRDARSQWDNILNDITDTTGDVFLGAGMQCARCHDHKFDPIPIKDYYSLHGIFASTVEPLHHPTIAATSKSASAARSDFTKRLGQLQDEQVAGFFRYMRETRARYDNEMAGRLMIASVRGGSAEAGDFSERYKISLQEDTDFAAMRIQKDSPITGPFYAVAQVPLVYFAERAPIAIQEAISDPDNPVNPIIAAALRGLKPKSLHDVAAAYQKAYNENKAAILAHLALLAKPGEDWKKTSPAIAEMTGYPWAIPSYDEVFDNEDMISLFSTRKFCADWQNRPIYGGIGNREPVAYFRHTRINELRLSHPGAPGEAMVVQDSEAPKDSYVFKRGDKNNKGEIVPRQFLEILSKGDRRPYVDGSGRYEFAQSIATKPALNAPWLCSSHFQISATTTGDSKTG